MDNYDEEDYGQDPNMSTEEADIDDGDQEDLGELETQGEDDDELKAALESAIADDFADFEAEDDEQQEHADDTRAVQDDEDDDMVRAGGEEDDVDPYSQADHDGDVDLHAPGADEDFPGSQQMLEDDQQERQQGPTPILQDPKAKRIFALMSVMSEEQLNRYEAYKRSQLPRPKVKKLMQSLTSYQPHERVIIAVSGVAKIFAGQLIETARRIASKEGHDGPLLPYQVQQAYQELDSNSKWPSVLSAPSRSMFPRRMSSHPSLPVVLKPGFELYSPSGHVDGSAEEEDEPGGDGREQEDEEAGDAEEQGMEYEMQEAGHVAGDAHEQEHERMSSQVAVQVH